MRPNTPNTTSEGCQSNADDSEACPPDPDGCTGPTCGGGKPDNRIDYGGCACGGKSSSSGTPSSPK